MKKKEAYICIRPINILKKEFDFTNEQLAEKLFCSGSTIDRLLKLNGSSNLDVIINISKLFSLNFPDDFVLVDLNLYNSLKTLYPNNIKSEILDQSTYYKLYVGRCDIFDVQVWGKTKWVDFYDNKSELRVLHEITKKAAKDFVRNGTISINSGDDFITFLLNAKLGEINDIIISQEAIQSSIISYTSEFLKDKGYEVYTIDFKNPLKSHSYNFVQPVIDAVETGDIPKAIESAWDITSTLVGETKGEKIWNNGEASVIASAIMSVIYDNKESELKEFQNMSNVYYFISEMNKVISSKTPMESYIKTLPDNHPAKGLLSISEIAPSRTKGSFYTSALTTLRLFTNPLIAGMTSTSEIGPKP